MWDPYELATLAQETQGSAAETITFKSKTGEGTYTTFTNIPARRGAKREVPVMLKGKKIVQRLLPWRLWAADLTAANAPVPKIGDQFVDADGVKHQVMEEVDTSLQGQVFNAFTKEVPS